MVLSSSAVTSTAGNQPNLSAAPSSDGPQTDVTVPPNTSPHVYQALLASAVTLGAGTAWYFIDDRNVMDWDYPSLKSRLTGSSWRYDNNNHWMNFNGHPLFGAGVYASARASHLSVPYAFLSSFLTSMTWEFVIEYNERVSINDVIVTPLAGFAVGEFAHQLGYYLSSSPRRTLGRSALRWTLSPLTPLAALGCNGEPRRDHPEDSLGYASGLWHDFSLASGVSLFRTDRQGDLAVADLRASGKLVSLPGYRAEGEGQSTFSDSDISRLSLNIEASREGPGVDLVTDSVLVGLRTKSLTAAGGYEHVVGAALGYRYQDSSARGQDDKRSWVGFPGVATELFWERPRLSSSIQLRAYPVFGGVSSPAFQRHYTLDHKENPDQVYRTVLVREGYFYGWGFAGELQAQQRLGVFHSEFALRTESLWSDGGLDRDQEKLTQDTKVSDFYTALGWSGWVRLPRSLAAGISAFSQLREARAANLRMRLNQRSLGLWLGTRF